MNHILSLGAINKQTGEYVYPKIAKHGWIYSPVNLLIAPKKAICNNLSNYIYIFIKNDK
jgi:hypothetical protein